MPPPPPANTSYLCRTGRYAHPPSMELKDIIDGIQPLPEASAARLASYASEIRYPKGHHILQAGRREPDIFFIARGIARAYVTHEGREITFWIGEEGAAVVSLRSYVRNEQ